MVKHKLNKIFIKLKNSNLEINPCLIRSMEVRLRKALIKLNKRAIPNREQIITVIMVV